MSKVSTVEAAVQDIPDGAVLMIGGFMGAGTPPLLMNELVRQGKKDLTLIVNDTARPGIGVGKLIDAGMVRKVVTSHIGTNPQTQKLMLSGVLDVELVPQGTLAERVRAGGAGLGGVLTATGVGTIAADNKKTVELNGVTYLVEEAIKADFALIAARTADYSGNLRYLLTSRNFNPLMALAADIVIAEPDEIVPIGCIEPDAVATPHVLVDLIVVKGASA